MGRMKRIFAVAMVVVMTIGFSVSTAFSSYAYEYLTYKQDILHSEYYITAYNLDTGVTKSILPYTYGYGTDYPTIALFEESDPETGPFLMRACFMTSVKIPVEDGEFRKITKMSIDMQFGSACNFRCFDSSKFSLIVSPGEQTFRSDDFRIENFDIQINDGAPGVYGVQLSFDFSNDPIVVENGTVFRFDLIGGSNLLYYDYNKGCYSCEVRFIESSVTYEYILADELDVMNERFDDLQNAIVGDPSDYEDVGADVESSSSDLINDASDAFDAMEDFDKSWQDSVQEIYNSLPTAKDPIGSLQGGLVMDSADGTIISRLWSLFEEYKEISIFFTSGLLIVCVYFFLRR